MFLLNGSPFNIDAPYTGPDGTQYPPRWFVGLTVAEREAHGLIEVPDPAPVDERFYYDASTPKPIGQIQQRLKMDLGMIRWSKELAGITYANNTYSTDMQSRLAYMIAVQQAATNNTYSTIWKTRSKFVNLSGADIIAINTAAAKHVDDCFTNEAAICVDIDAADTLEELQSIDLNEGWPE
jgi:hypothetical protein